MLGVGLFATGIVTSLPPVILSLVGGLGISMLLMGWLTWGKLGGSELILGGIALSLGAGALCTGLQSLLDAQGALMMTRWSLGHLEQIGYEALYRLPSRWQSSLLAFGSIVADGKCYPWGRTGPAHRAFILGLCG